jgi:hypothetical protein
MAVIFSLVVLVIGEAFRNYTALHISLVGVIG